MVMAKMASEVVAMVGEQNGSDRLTQMNSSEAEEEMEVMGREQGRWRVEEVAVKEEEDEDRG
jgi:hypothetical protein